MSLQSKQQPKHQVPALCPKTAKPLIMRTQITTPLPLMLLITLSASRLGCRLAHSRHNAKEARRHARHGAARNGANRARNTAQQAAHHGAPLVVLLLDLDGRAQVPLQVVPLPAADRIKVALVAHPLFAAPRRLQVAAAVAPLALAALLALLRRRDDGLDEGVALGRALEVALGAQLERVVVRVDAAGRARLDADGRAAVAAVLAAHVVQAAVGALGARRAHLAEVDARLADGDARGDDARRPLFGFLGPVRGQRDVGGAAEQRGEAPGERWRGRRRQGVAVAGRRAGLEADCGAAAGGLVDLAVLSGAAGFDVGGDAGGALGEASRRSGGVMVCAARGLLTD